MQSSAKKPYRGISMEGMLATWYAKITRKDLSEFESLAQKLAKDLPRDARVLEVAPGPGYLCVALGKLGPYKITGLDISQSFVKIAAENARKAGVAAHFIHGSASDIPQEDGFFDLIVCRAAFKNFTEPVAALKEMRRVLRSGGKALIIDLRRDAPKETIDEYVDKMNMGAINSAVTKLTFRLMLLKRAYTRDEFNQFISESGFENFDVQEVPIGFEIWLFK